MEKENQCRKFLKEEWYNIYTKSIGQIKNYANKKGFNFTLDEILEESAKLIEEKYQTPEEIKIKKLVKQLGKDILNEQFYIVPNKHLVSVSDIEKVFKTYGVDL